MIQKVENEVMKKVVEIRKVKNKEAKKLAKIKAEYVFKIKIGRASCRERV